MNQFEMCVIHGYLKFSEISAGANEVQNDMLSIDIRVCLFYRS